MTTHHNPYEPVEVRGSKVSADDLYLRVQRCWIRIGKVGRGQSSYYVECSEIDPAAWTRIRDAYNHNGTVRVRVGNHVSTSEVVVNRDADVNYLLWFYPKSSSGLLWFWS